MRWVAVVGLCVGAVASCGGRPNGVPVGSPTADAGGSADSGAAVAVAMPATVTDAGAAADALPPADGGIDARPDATTVGGTSCDPLPNVFLFPPPPAGTPGAYARCASFAEARAAALAVSADGGRVILVGADGIARVIDPTRRLVIGVLAPPRATVELAAFSPDGRSILTVSVGERLATLWRADTFTPLWTTSLPGHTYFREWGDVNFSPDGKTAVVSPGADLFLLDVATGTIRATRASPTTTIIGGAAYGWNGRRIAVLDIDLHGMCVPKPHGGSVAILDPDTLVQMDGPMHWARTNDNGPEPGVMRVARDADLVVTSGSQTAPGVHAFRLSDGAPLPAPAFSAMPSVLTPDGTAGLVASGGVMQLQQLADGAVIASTAAPAPAAVAMSADGSTIAAGSNGPNLLGIWKPGQGGYTAACSAEPRTGNTPARQQAALAANGQAIAVEWGPEIRVFRPADGTLLSTAGHQDLNVQSVSVSPDARYVVGAFYPPAASSAGAQVVFRSEDGVEVANLNDPAAVAAGTLWTSFAVDPAGAFVDGIAATSDASSFRLVQLDLSTGARTASPVLFDQWTTLDGISGGCAVVTNVDGTWRACAGAAGPVFAAPGRGGVLSTDGTAYLTQDPSPGADISDAASTTLWQVLPAPTPLRTYPPRPEEADWNATETPVAVSAGGARVITGAQQFGSCPFAPAFTSRVQDVATGAVIDELPPGVTSASADLSAVAIGTTVWCAR